MSFERQQELAKENWAVVYEESFFGVTYVEAEAKTGSRYAVVISSLPYGAGSRLGGDQLVSVIQPWQTTYPITTFPGGLHPSYIAEKFLRPGSSLKDVHGGDFEAICLTINHAINAFHQK